MKPSDDRESAAVFDFLDDYLGDLEAGRQHELAHYLARYPGFEEAIAREFLTLRSNGAVGAAQEIERAPVEPEERRLGPYRLLRELGRGGQGSVWLAEDVRLARKVALKVLASRFETVSDDRRRRFRREAEVIARMEHPGICPIYDADIDADTPWIAMRYVEGSTLAQLLGEARRARENGDTPTTRLDDSPESEVTSEWPPRRALDVQRTLLLFERCARALHAAHEAGVIHRDFKPGNVIVTPDGKPVILDFGLAREESSDAGSITETGDIFGTPAYMSPEQLHLASHELDRRTDVYSLGIALYEALTLERPFAHEAKGALYAAIQRDPPRDPRELNPALSLDVKVVLETALAKEREHRYASALDLAEDLRRIREYEPIQARPAGWPLKLSRWARRHPALAIAIPGTIGALAIGLIVTLSLLRAKEAALSDALGRHLSHRCEALTQTDPTAALTLGIEAVERAPNDSTRMTLVEALEACRLQHMIKREGAKVVHDLDLSPDGTRIALAWGNGEVGIYDTRDAQQIALLGGSSVPAQAVAWVDDARVIAAYGDDRAAERTEKSKPPNGSAERDDKSRSLNGSLVLWAAATRTRIAEQPFGGTPVSIELHRGGARALVVGATCDDARVHRLVDVNTLALVGERGHGGPGEFASSETRLAGDSDTVLHYEPAGGEALRVRTSTGDTRPMGRVCSVGFDASGTSNTVVGTTDGHLYLLDRALDEIASGALNDGSLPQSIVGLAVHGDRVVACTRPAGANGKVDVHLLARAGERLTKEREPLSLPADTDVRELVFDPSGVRFVVPTSVSSLIVDVPLGTTTTVLTGLLQPERIEWSPDGGTLWTSCNSPEVRAWFADGPPDVTVLPALRRGARATSVALSADGTKVLVDCDGYELFRRAGPGFARVDRSSFPSVDGEPRGTFSRLFEPAPLGAYEERIPPNRALGFLPGDRRAWRATFGAVMPLDPSAGPGAAFANPWTRYVVTSRDGGIALALDDEGGVHSMSVGDRLERGWSRQRTQTACPVGIAIDDDGKRAALGMADGSITIVDAMSGTDIKTLRDETIDRPASLVAFRPRTSELASFHEDMRLRIWNVETGERRVLRTGANKQPVTNLPLFPPRSMEYSKDGELLLVSGRAGGGAVRVFTSEPFAAIAFDTHHTQRITAARLSEDARYVLTASRDGSVFVRETRTGLVFARREFPGRAVVAAAFDGSLENPRIATVTDDGVVRVWPTDPLPAARARFLRELAPWEIDRERKAAAPLEYP